MSDTDDLVDVFGPLRNSPTRAELADEAAVVDAMAHAHKASKGRITMLNSRKARVATLIAAGIIGFGGVAAAGPGGFQSLELPEDPVETTIATTVPDEIEEPATTTETTELPETSVSVTSEAPEAHAAQEEQVEDVDAEVPVAPLVDDPDTDFDETTCEEGNHGKTVSAAARDDEGFGGANTDESELEVRDAAHSSCGKKSDSEHDEETEAKEAADADREADSDDDDDKRDEKAEKSEKKNGNSASEDRGNNGRGKNKKDD